MDDKHFHQIVMRLTTLSRLSPGGCRLLSTPNCTCPRCDLDNLLGYMDELKNELAGAWDEIRVQLSPTNENVRRGYLRASLRDMRQIMVLALENCEALEAEVTRLQSTKCNGGVTDPDCPFCVQGDIPYATAPCSGDAMAGRQTLVHHVDYRYYSAEVACTSRATCERSGLTNLTNWIR